MNPFKTLNKRKLILSASLSILFTTMQIIGYQISMYYGTSVHQSAFFQKIGILSITQCLLLALTEFLIWCTILYCAFTFLEKTKILEIKLSRKTNILLWVAATVLLFSCWLPCFMAAYPGFYNYDAMNQIPQVLYEEVPYSAHHPLLHTLLMGKIIAFGYHHGVDLNDGIALHSIFQMIICAMSFAYMLCYLLKTTGRRRLCAIAFCYYAFFPPIAMFAMSTTKDTIFSLLLQLSILLLYEMCKDIHKFFSSKSKMIRFIAVILLMCLFRKNGIYAIVCVIPFVMIHGKNYRKQLLLLFGCVLALYFTASKSLLWALDAVEGSTEEALSVPMQQIARVYCDYGEEAFEEEELAIIYEGISKEYLSGYDPFLSDAIKNYFDFNVILDNKMDYIMLWIGKGIQYPEAYIKAFLDNTYQAWYPGTSIYDDPDEEQTYYFDMTMHAGGKRDSKNPELLEFYRKIANEYSYQKFPLIRLLFSIGAMLWAALFTLFFAIYQRNKPLITTMLLIMFYCATVFMGPISLVRYYLVLFYGFPINIGFLFQRKPNTL